MQLFKEQQDALATILIEEGPFFLTGLLVQENHV